MIDPENISSGAIGGIIGSVLAWLVKHQINSLERRVDNLSEKVVFIDVFREFEKRFMSTCDNIYDRLEKIDTKLEKLTNNYKAENLK